MDPVNLLSVAYSLYESIDNNLKTVIQNKKQFELLGRRIDSLAAPIKKLQETNKSIFGKKLQCSDKALKGLVSTLESVKLFVGQPRFQKPDGDKVSNLLHFISQMYHASEDNESFVHFDKLLSNDIQNLNFGITVSIFDYSAAAAKDDETVFKESGLTSKPELRHIDIAKLEWDQNNVSDRLGQGAFSVVWKGKYKSEPVAIKQVLNLTTLSQKDIRTITKEALLMQFSDHAHVLKVEGVCLSQGLLVMELALCSLSEYLYRPTTPETAVKAQKVKLARIDSLLSLSDQIRWRLEIILQICDALQYLHRFNILHRDLKSPNVMLFLDTAKNKVIAKIGDFGLALAVDFITRTTTGHVISKMSTFLPNAVGTYNYMAPELFERQPGERVAYSESSDVYSLGILINEIMSGTMPWGEGAREVDIMNWVVNKSLRPDMWTVCAKPSAAEKELFAIVGRSDSSNVSCLHQSQQHRPSANDVYTAATGRRNPSARFSQRLSEIISPLKTGRTNPSARSPQRLSEVISPLNNQSPDWVKEVLFDITDVDQPLVQHFVGELLVRFNDISEKNALRYAEALFQQFITSCERLNEQLRDKNKQAPRGAVDWLKSLDFHQFDIADIVAMDAPQTNTNLTRKEEVLKLQGVDILEEWIKTNVSTINIPRNRRQWAQYLWDNNITTVHRLMKYGDDLNLLKSMGIIELDAKDIYSYIQAEPKRLLEIKYQWRTGTTRNLDAAKSVACCAPCCSTVMEPYTCACCLCFLPLIFNPVERKSVKYQWTDNARSDNKEYFSWEQVKCTAICCSRVMSPEACAYFFGVWWCGRTTDDGRVLWCISCPFLFPFWITYGVCLCCEDHLCRKVRNDY